jgi:hypothetical protein
MTWAGPRQDCEERIRQEASEQMDEFIFEGEYIKEVINSQADRGVCAVNGIYHQLFKVKKRESG